MFINLEEFYIRNNELVYQDDIHFKKDFLKKVKLLKKLKVMEIRFNTFLNRHFLQRYKKIIKK
jgi:hypothetical protein